LNITNLAFEEHTFASIEKYTLNRVYVNSIDMIVKNIALHLVSTQALE